MEEPRWLDEQEARAWRAYTHMRRHFELCEALQWDRSRLSHQLTRMDARGLVTKEVCPTDARGSYVVLTAAGRAAIESAAPAHVAAVRRYVIEALDTDQLAALADSAETVLAHLDAQTQAGPARAGL